MPLNSTEGQSINTQDVSRVHIAVFHAQCTLQGIVNVNKTLYFKIASFQRHKSYAFQPLSCSGVD